MPGLTTSTFGRDRWFHSCGTGKPPETEMLRERWSATRESLLRRFLPLPVVIKGLHARFQSVPPFWLAVITVGLAGLARLPWLMWHSLDVDEAFSLYWARIPLGKLVADLLVLRGDPHPPAYYALLKPWIALLGENEIGLRLFSALSGVIFVALMYRLGKELFSARVGVAAALLAALAPPLVYESLDARMYMPAAVFVLAGSLLLWRALERDGRGGFVAAIGWLVLACYSHIAGSLAVAGLAASLVIVRGRRFWKGALALAAVGVAYLPYAVHAWQVSSAQEGAVHLWAPGLWELLRLTANWSLFHHAAVARWLALGSGVVVWGVVVWGLAGRSKEARARGWVMGNLGVPLLLVIVLSQRRALFQPKLLVITTLAPLLLAVSLSRRAWVVVLLLVPQVWGYVALWQPAAQRENWRAAGDYLTAHVGPHDVAVVHLHFYEEPLRLYYSGPTVVPYGSRLTTYDQVADGLAPYLDAEVLWLVQSGTDYTDPDRLLENWLSQRYPLVTEQFPNRITVKGFLLHPTGFSSLPGTLPLEVEFAGGARVTGVWLDAQVLSARDVWLHPPSNWLHVTLYATPADYTLSLEDDVGNIWGQSLQRVYLRQLGLPVPARPDEIVRLDYDINLNPETPPGTYKVVLRVAGAQGYDPRADTGDSYLILDLVEIMPSR
jgi:mannosyltransferase